MVAPNAIGKASFAVFGSVLLLSVACSSVSGSGRVVTKPVPVSSFSRILVSDVFDVTVSTGQQDKVTLRVDDNLVDRLDVGVSNGTLRLGLKSGTSVRNATLHANVGVVRLSGIEVSGSSKVHLSPGFTADSLEVTLSGASKIDGSLECGSAKVTLSGASNATLSGTAERLDIDASGASRLDVRNLQAVDVSVGLSGASQATVWAMRTLSARASGASSLRYRGSPQISRKDASGASSIEPL